MGEEWGVAGARGSGSGCGLASRAARLILGRLASNSLLVGLLPPVPAMEGWRAEAARARSRRSLHAAGVGEAAIRVVNGPADAELGSGSILLLRAGCWLVREGPLLPPPGGPVSGQGPAVVAIGLPRAATEFQVPVTDETQRWQALQARGGGEFDPATIPDLPCPPALWLNAAAARALRKHWVSAGDWSAAWSAFQRGVRIVRWPAADVFFDPSLRVVQLVTSWQRGGAERVALDLTAELRRQGMATWLIGLGRPTRPAFTPPAGALDLGGWNVAQQVPVIRRVASHFGADLFHAHLVDWEFATEVSVFPGAPAWPMAHTLHNTQAAWPTGFTADRLSKAGATQAFFACSRAIDVELRATGTGACVRTIWNGIADGYFAMGPEQRRELRATVRAQLGLTADALVLVAVANPRPQKRLERLPAILSAGNRLRQSRDPAAEPIHLLLLGSPAAHSAVAAECQTAITTAATALGVQAQIHVAGDVADVRPWLAAADVLVNVSAHEGLSLAQLEALAAGLPVVATAVGGAPEIAAHSSSVHLLPVAARPEACAETILNAVARAAAMPMTITLPGSFTLPVMTARYRLMYERFLAAGAERSAAGTGVWLITNNFSTGGAQSSARRLLLEFSRRGHRVTAVTLQESAEHPTAGTLALRAAGIRVRALPPPDEVPSTEAIRELLQWLDEDPPAAVLGWNALAEYKLRLAEVLSGVRFFDVSPGEMYFTSLERSFRNLPVGLPWLEPAEYGRRLAGVVVKYRAEVPRALALGAPVQVQPNGVPLLPVTRRSAPAVVRFGTAARLHPHKRLELLLSAFRAARSRMPPAELLIAGAAEADGDTYAADLRASVADLPVIWLGEVTAVSPWLGGLDVFVVIAEPAGCPNASLEAMSAGLPVLATDHGGMAEQVVDGVTGRLVGREDVTGLADAMVELALDPGRRADWGDAGRARIEAMFSLRQMADGYERILGLAVGVNVGGGAADSGAAVR